MVKGKAGIDVVDYVDGGFKERATPDASISQVCPWLCTPKQDSTQATKRKTTPTQIFHTQAFSNFLPVAKKEHRTSLIDRFTSKVIYLFISYLIRHHYIMGIVFDLLTENSPTVKQYFFDLFSLYIKKVVPTIVSFLWFVCV